MRFGSVTVVLSTLVCSVSLANSPNTSGFNLNPGERVVAIDGVPVNSANGRQVQGRMPQGQMAQGQVRQASFQPVRNVATNIVGNLVRSNQPFSYTPGETALDKANHERRRNGVGNLIPDPRLQQLALQKAQIAASRGYKNHIGGSLGGARAEGVGHTNGRFLSCCLDMPATYGGAAMVQGRDGWYCCLLVR
jgi:hypothetical protein